MKTECDCECIPVLKYSKCPAYCVHQHMDCYFLLVFPLCLRTQQVRYSQNAQSGDWEATSCPHLLTAPGSSGSQGGSIHWIIQTYLLTTCRHKDEPLGNLRVKPNWLSKMAGNHFFFVYF